VKKEAAEKLKGEQEAQEKEARKKSRKTSYTERDGDC
jgi:hypothetical protein